jgi:hypothetical protein
LWVDSIQRVAEKRAQEFFVDVNGAHGLLQSSKEGDYFNLWSSPVRLAGIRENQLTLASVVATVCRVWWGVKLAKTHQKTHSKWDSLPMTENPNDRYATR